MNNLMQILESCKLKCSRFNFLDSCIILPHIPIPNINILVIIIFLEIRSIDFSLLYIFVL